MKFAKPILLLGILVLALVYAQRRTIMRSVELGLKDALLQDSGSALGEGQYRNAVASGQARTYLHKRPDATALRY